jgi:hypothetical protein
MTVQTSDENSAGKMEVMDGMRLSAEQAKRTMVLLRSRYRKTAAVSSQCGPQLQFDLLTRSSCLAWKKQSRVSVDFIVNAAYFV